MHNFLLDILWPSLLSNRPSCAASSYREIFVSRKIQNSWSLCTLMKYSQFGSGSQRVWKLSTRNADATFCTYST
jgi:hypothetical protein